MNDEVLAANDRGHTAKDVRRASALIKQSGIKLGLQMMTGLYKDTPERCLETADEFIKLAPKTVRIYPTVILKKLYVLDCTQAPMLNAKCWAEFIIPRCVRLSRAEYFLMI